MGDRLEEWVLTSLQQVLHGKLRAMDIPSFLTQTLADLKRAKNVRPQVPAILDALQSETWWATLLVNRQTVTDFLRSGNCSPWQQAGADIVLVQGVYPFNRANELTLINVKSHSVDRDSRPPNIMSGQRLLEFFHYLLTRGDRLESLTAANLWFIGVGYDGRSGTIRTTQVKDLFKLAVDRIPQINFDAAIQLQFDVDKIPEVVQSRTDFVRQLAERFIKDWRVHSLSKERRYSRLTSEIIARLDHPA
ncbi:MAG: HincII family type II restriction endonuclease [Nitrososphaerota archaeon]|jgi:hypothetical protein|nr:HincII family type II restriction endonuclease [Nitrososphaerota archaeon]